MSDMRTPFERAIDEVSAFRVASIFETPENAGARLADDHVCQGCGARGVVGFCAACSR